MYLSQGLEPPQREDSWSAKKGNLLNADTMSQLTSRNASHNSSHICDYLPYAREPGGGSRGSLPPTLGPCGRCPKTVSPNREVIAFCIFVSFFSSEKTKG